MIVRLPIACALLMTLVITQARTQQSQNPSPMVEHTRAHARLKESAPPGRREALDIGTLFVPAGAKPATLLFFFHGGTWLPELTAAQNRMAAVSVQAGSGSAAYARLFTDESRFPALLKQAETKAGVRFTRVILGGWSAGCGAVRQILRSPEAYARANSIVLIDGIHTDYPDGKPGPQESKLGAENLDIWVKLGRDAIAGRKRVLITHSEIFPGTFASTTETTDYLVRELDLKRKAVLKWGAIGTQQLSEVRSGKFLLLGFAGNSAPDHVDQLHSLPAYLKLLR